MYQLLKKALKGLANIVILLQTLFIMFAIIIVSMAVFDAPVIVYEDRPVNVYRIKEVPTPLSPVECQMFGVVTPGKAAGVAYMGVIELCGRDMDWGNVKGPISSFTKPDGQWAEPPPPVNRRIPQ